MKYMNVKKKYQSFDLQLFADHDANEAGGEDIGEGDDQTDDESDEGGEEEKKFSQKDIDEAVKKRLAREKRKWQREQQKGKLDNEGSEKNSKDDKDTQILKEKAAKAENLELKWTCLEHDVDKTCVDDVLALARVHMAKDADMDIEDAIEAVLKKYPQFKEGSSEKNEEEKTGKSWGERQNGQRRKSDGVTDAFLKKNPGLKID